MLACSKGHKNIVQLLLEHPSSNVDLNAKANNGETALMIASQGGLVIRPGRCFFEKSEGHHNIVQLIKAKLNP